MTSLSLSQTRFFFLFTIRAIRRALVIIVVVVVNDLSVKTNNSDRAHSITRTWNSRARARLVRDFERTPERNGRKKRKGETTRGVRRTKVRRRESLRTEFCNRPSSTSPVAYKREAPVIYPASRAEIIGGERKRNFRRTE